MSEDETADILPVILGTRAAKLFVDANSFDIISDDTMKKVKDCPFIIFRSRSYIIQF